MNTGTTRRRSPLFFLLLCVLGGVWGYVFFLLATGMEDGATVAVPAATTSAVPTLVPPDARRTVFVPDFRDPFSPPPALAVSDATEAVGEAARPPPSSPEPLLVLQGVVGGTAMLQESGAAVVFAAAGDTVGGARIVAVEADHVVAAYGGRACTLLLKR